MHALIRKNPATIAAAVIEPLGAKWLLVLHLLPGVLIGATFVLLAAVLRPTGAPANLALLLAMLMVALPVEVGYVRWIRRHGVSIGSVNMLPRRQAAPLISLLFIWSVVIYTLLAPVATGFQRMLFGWWPSWLQLGGLAEQLFQLEPVIVWTIVGLSLALNIAVPWVEELYFRGYLLPGMGRFGRWASLFNTAPFSLYHLWLPWEFLSRVVALVPTIYVVWWKRDLQISTWVHVLLNSTGSIGLLVLALTS